MKKFSIHYYLVYGNTRSVTLNEIVDASSKYEAKRTFKRTHRDAVVIKTLPYEDEIPAKKEG